MKTAVPVLALLALLAGAAGADDLEERVPVRPGGLLEVDLYMGEGLRPDPGWLEVLSHDSDEVRVAATAEGWGSSGVDFRLERDGETVRLYGRVTGAVSWLFGGPRTTVRVWVPRRFSLDLRSSAGPIRIDDVSGDIRARAGDAPIEASGIAGSLKLHAGEGDIRVSEVKGDVDLRVRTGSISLSWVEGSVEARASAGEIEADHVQGSLVLNSGRGAVTVREVDGSVVARTERGAVFTSFTGEPSGDLETSRGSVRVVIPDGAGAELEAISRQGSVEVASGLRIRGLRQASLARGRIGAGGGTLRLYTARGSVYLSRR